MTGDLWKGAQEDLEGALQLIDEATVAARAAGDPREAEGWASLGNDAKEHRIAGTVARDSARRPWGLAVATVFKGKGRRIGPIFLTADRRRPEDWARFLTGVLGHHDSSGPILIMNGATPGLTEPEAAALLSPRGFHAFHRVMMVYPPGTPPPPESGSSLAGGHMRTLGRADFDALAELNSVCYAGSAERFLFGCEFEPLPAARSLLEALFEGKFGSFAPEASFGLELGGRLAGATIVTRRPTHSLLADVAVHPDFQGQGHARRLVRASLQVLLADARVPVGLAVTEENTVAAALYRKMGFVVHQGEEPFWVDPTALGVAAPPLRG